MENFIYKRIHFTLIILSLTIRDPEDLAKRRLTRCQNIARPFVFLGCCFFKRSSKATEKWNYLFLSALTLRYVMLDSGWKQSECQRLCQWKTKYAAIHDVRDQNSLIVPPHSSATFERCEDSSKAQARNQRGRGGGCTEWVRTPHRTHR